MSSSTSGFELSWTRCLLPFLATAGVLFGLNFKYRRQVPSHPPLEFVSELPDPDDWFVVNDASAGVLEHAVLYNGLKGTKEHMRKAKVLLLGNSRIMVAFTRASLKPFFDRYGLDYYALGFSAEGHELPAEVVRRFDLQPRLVIANPDVFFAPRQFSPWAKEARLGRFRNWKRIFEADAMRWLRHLVHPYATHLLAPSLGIDEYTVYRSRSDGTWGIRLPGPAKPFQDDPRKGDVVSESHVETALQFREELARRGAQLIFLYVPTPTNSRTFAEILAQRTGVPLISPRLPGLASPDGSHLTAESARTFSAACLEELEPRMKDYGFEKVRR